MWNHLGLLLAHQLRRQLLRFRCAFSWGRPNPLALDGFSRTSADIIYIVHYVYVLWLQRALMGVDLHASLKFLAVFTGATLFSWLTAQCLLGFPWLRKVL